jgi:cytochrome c biogenesis factor
MSVLSVSLSISYFIVIGLAYVRGYDVVKRHSPGHLVHFYLIMTAIRMLLTATVVVVYVLLSDSRDDSIRFAAMFMSMYAVMMVVTLILKH